VTLGCHQLFCQLSPIGAGDVSSSVVYAMQVTRALSMRAYDAWSARHLRVRPEPSHPDPRRSVGDSNYNPQYGGLS
jgi:hypothetical protein